MCVCVYGSFTFMLLSFSFLLASATHTLHLIIENRAPHRYFSNKSIWIFFLFFFCLFDINLCTTTTCKASRTQMKMRDTRKKIQNQSIVFCCCCCLLRQYTMANFDLNGFWFENRTEGKKNVRATRMKSTKTTIHLLHTHTHIHARTNFDNSKPQQQKKTSFSSFLWIFQTIFTLWTTSKSMDFISFSLNFFFFFCTLLSNVQFNTIFFLAN